MPLRPWVGQEPVKVYSDVPKQVDEPLLKVRTALNFNSVVWLGPSENEIWDISSVYMDIHADATVGVRGLMLYIMDRDGQTFRIDTFGATAGQVCQGIGNRSLGYGNYSFSFTFPTFVDYLEHPCQMGALWIGIAGATDFGTFGMVYRRRTQLS